MAASDDKLLKKFSALLLENDMDEIIACRLRSTMTKAWSLEGNLKFVEAGKNTFLLVFELLVDKRKVWYGAPWSFNRNLFALNHFEANVSSNSWTFPHSEFWVQVNGIPLEYYSEKAALTLAAKLGEPIPVDSFNPSKWSKYI
ncbi:uncharacterized protein At4g02000-like [Typha angustifolia]|uniref:uncharacterized protein At4g02000-like n=1 Tax=Typha angustifolia TaxID=59011 RepID=UPI003C2D1B88